MAAGSARSPMPAVQPYREDRPNVIDLASRGNQRLSTNGRANMPVPVAVRTQLELVIRHEICSGNRVAGDLTGYLKGVLANGISNRHGSYWRYLISVRCGVR
jgi:hypothetical protein